MGIFDSIWSAGEQLIGSNDSPIGNLIGGVINTVGKDGWDGIVNEVTNTDSGLWGSAVSIVKDELGPEYGGLVDGIKAAADGDTNAVFGSVIGGVRDYVGAERFDGIATTVGEAVNGETGGWWNELSGHVTNAVGNDGFTAIVNSVNDMGLGNTGDGWLNDIYSEVRETVGEDTWGYFETAAGVHTAIVENDEDVAPTKLSADSPEVDADTTVDPDETVDPFDDDADGPSTDDSFGETVDPFEQPAAETPDSPFGDMELGDILESSGGNTGIVPPQITDAADPVTMTADDPVTMTADDPVTMTAEDIVSPAQPAPIMTTQPVEAAVMQPAVEPDPQGSFLVTQAETVEIPDFEPTPVPSFQAEVATVDDAYDTVVESFFAEEAPADQVDDPSMTEMA